MLLTIVLLLVVSFLIAMLLNFVWGSTFAQCQSCKAKQDTVSVWAGLAQMDRSKASAADNAADASCILDDDSDDEESEQPKRIAPDNHAGLELPDVLGGTV